MMRWKSGFWNTKSEIRDNKSNFDLLRQKDEIKCENDEMKIKIFATEH